MHDDAQFTDLSTGAPTSWAWSFGDGDVSTEQDPVHVYHAQGLFTVTLTATNVLGSDLETKVDYINIPEPALLTQLLSGIFGLFAIHAYRKRD